MTETGRLALEHSNMTDVERPTPWFDDRAKCDGCGKTKDRVIRRLPKTVKLCDDCYEEKRK